MRPPALLAAALLLSAACAQPRQGAAAGSALAEGTPPAQSAPPAAEGDTGRIARLEREARALARTEGCDSDGSCRAAPLGSRACGGPRAYLPYCATTTDTVALMARLQELKRAEDDYNRSSGMMSTCEFREAPVVVREGRSCRFVGREGREEVP
jgi:hypothetical protein